MGAEAPFGTTPFIEVEPRRWFVPNCVDAERFAPCEPDAELAALRPILVPRNLYRNRGVHLAVEAFARIAEGAEGTHLVIVGADSQPAYRAECEALVRALGLRERVVFHGPAAWEDMPRVYSSAEISLVPSLCGEGTSLSALESMACGTPVVATMVGGLLDLPCLHAKPDAEPLAAAMQAALADRAALAESQRSAVLATYNLDNWASAWLSVIEEVGP